MEINVEVSQGTTTVCLPHDPAARSCIFSPKDSKPTHHRDPYTHSAQELSYGTNVLSREVGVYKETWLISSRMFSTGKEDKAVSSADR